MKTNYKVKPKKSLRPLKAGLLVLAMVCFGLSTYAQQNKTVRVANDQQLQNAVENPAVRSMVIDAGYYASLQRYLGPGITAVKMDNGGNRTSDCIYAIQESATCFDPVPPATTVCDTARALTFDLFACGCCPGNDAGTWSVVSGPGNVTFTGPLSSDTIEFCVDAPGAYLLRYDWGAPYNSYVSTEYYFYGVPELNLVADDVCGLTTEVIFTYDNDFFDPNKTVEWTLNGEPYAGPTTSDTFDLTVPWCGIWNLEVTVTPSECPPQTESTTHDFSCDPIADAGPDAFICNDLCYTLVGDDGLWFTFSNNYATVWNQLEGPADLLFENPFELTTEVCRDETADCSYGVYEVELEVLNGECLDTDTTLLTFYEQPTADAGDDFSLCADFCFSLDATPYEYCGVEGENYWSHRWWVLVSQPGECDVDFDPLDAQTSVCITDCGETCSYGDYVFRWYEVNVKVVGGDTLWSESHCIASDDVVISVYETPDPDAGEDMFLCNDFAFTLYGVGDPSCFQRTIINYEWNLVSQPDDACEVTIDPLDELETGIVIDCPDCGFGEYVFSLTQSNGYLDDAGAFVEVCSAIDSVSVFIFEQPVADAGENFSMCYMGGCFSLAAEPYPYCSPELEDERFGKWTKVGGPAAVTFSDDENPTSDACPDENADCYYGLYTFVWTEYNGTCVDADTVLVTLYEPPTADAGDDAEYCLDAEYSMMLWHTFAANAYEYCQESGFEAPYGYWSKSCGPGYVTFYEEGETNGWVNVSAFGCYCFVWHEVNGDCEATDTIEVCFYEHPYLEGEDLSDSTCTELCYDLGLLGIVPYEYLPEPNVNYNVQGWVKVAGAGEPTFTPNASDPDAEVCVDEYGCYTFAFIQYNGDEDCADTVLANLWFFENPVADAGDDAELCGNCYMMSALPFSYVVNECAPAEDQVAYWAWFSYIPPADPCPDDYYSPYYYPVFTILGGEIHNPEAEICVMDTYCGTHHGMYGFEWVEHNGTCEDRDTVWVDFNKKPDPLPLYGWYEPNNWCSPYMYGPGRDNGNPECPNCWVDCLYPGEEVITVCADACLYFSIDWDCLCENYSYQGCPCGPIPGWTYEWSFTGPAGSFFEADPYWYDCDAMCWRGSDDVYICFGECCDTARLYLTITTPEGCVTTEEWKFFVQHRPDATISGPEVAEVSSVFEYSIPEPENPCYLYVWEVEHCGEIVYGQGTGEIGVHWTDYNVNGGWGLIYVEVYDTCTGCCNTDSLWVQVFPQYTLGDATLSGHVYYHNNINTPLNGVEITLWNAGVPVFTTTSFNDIEGGNGVGYYEFPGINGVTDFAITASYDAPWYGANATDALAVELKVVNNLPGSFVWNSVVAEAMDVNNSNTITATDALWIKQRAISMVNYFPNGNWVFLQDTTTAGTYNIMTLNYGDANRSNIPASMKETPAIALVADGVMNVEAGQEFELPIRVADASQFGAITLNLGYNSALIEVVDVVAQEGMLSSIANGNVSVAWSSIAPMTLSQNDVVIILKAKALGVMSASDELFTIGLGSEFADATAKVIEPVTLKTYSISTEPAAVDYFLSANRPNPFSTSTFIEYTLPETGKVKLSVLDMLGQEIAVLVESTQSAGSYTVEFANPGLATGVYIYKITVDGETRDYISTQRMVVSH